MFKKIQTVVASHKTEILIVLGAVVISIFLNFYKSTEVPGCLNSDEVAFGYNAFSILKTGGDEFGTKLPLRLKSFNDFKLPLYTYLSMPFVGVFGLNDFSTRLLNKVMAVLLIPSMYVFTLYLFRKKKIAYLASYLLACAPWIYIISRHAHEGVLLVFFLLWSLYFIVKYQREHKLSSLCWANLFLVLSTHSYHLGRIFLIVFLAYQAYLIFEHTIHVSFKNRQLKLNNGYGHIAKWIVCVALTLAASLGVDALSGIPRVTSLLFFKDSGFQMRLDEKLNEHGNRTLHNKLSEAVLVVTRKYIQQTAPEFFISQGDKNPRFGFEGIGLITPVEYILVFIGIYYLFKKKNEFRFLILYLLAASPGANALTWQEASLIRTYFMIFPILLSASYGAYSLLKEQKKNLKIALMAGLLVTYLFFNIQSWDMYLNHYYKKALVERAWQCGYKELVSYINSRYDKTNKFYITRKHGQPYIYILFYNKVDPKVFQKSVSLTAPDEYGFTQVRSFDKYNFKFRSDFNEKGVTFIGYPDDFDSTVNMKRIKKIEHNGEVIFWILEN